MTTLSKEQLAKLGLAEDATTEQINDALAALTDPTKMVNSLKDKGFTLVKPAKAKNKKKKDDDEEEGDDDMGSRCDAIEERMDTLEEGHKDHGKKLDDILSHMDKQSKSIDKLVTKHTEADDKAKNDAVIAFKSRASETITNAIKERKLTLADDAVSAYKELATDDDSLTKVVNTIKALPVNVQAPKFVPEIVKDADGKVVPTIDINNPNSYCQRMNSRIKNFNDKRLSALKGEALNFM